MCVTDIPAVCRSMSISKSMSSSLFCFSSRVSSVSVSLWKRLHMNSAAALRRSNTNTLTSSFSCNKAYFEPPPPMNAVFHYGKDAMPNGQGSIQINCHTNSPEPDCSSYVVTRRREAPFRSPQGLSYFGIFTKHFTQSSNATLQQRPYYIHCNPIKLLEPPPIPASYFGIFTKHFRVIQLLHLLTFSACCIPTCIYCLFT